jgi:hypothetical protein
MKKILFLSILFFFFACPKSETTLEEKDVVDLLPLDNEISGWTRSSATEIAENETQLWDLIDGAGQVYIDCGFVKCAFQTYAGTITGPVELQFRIFDMGDTSNAKDVYDELSTGSEIPWTDNHAGVEARYELITGIVSNYYELDFWDDKFYTWIEINDGEQAALDVAKIFALNVSDAIRDTTESK